jgi:hypothetical protein
LDRARSEIGTGLFRQIWFVLRHEPLPLLRYLGATIRLLLDYLFVPRAARPSFARRVATLGKILQVNFRIPGAVPPLDCLVLAEGLSAAPPGVVVEVGVFKGRSSALLSHLCARAGRRMIAIDTFAGLPESDTAEYAAADAPDRTYLWERGQFAGTRGEFDRHVSQFGAASVLTAVASDIRHVDRIPLDDDERVAFCFFDVDLLDSYRGCIAAVSTQLAPGARMYLHEGSLSPIRELLLDNGFWTTLGLNPPGVEFVHETAKFQTNLACLTFQGDR